MDHENTILQLLGVIDIRTAKMEECIGLALFGVGRAGNIHFKNIVGNHRVMLKYIVECDVEKANALVTKYRLGETKVVSTAEQNLVYEDSTVDAVIVCSPTFTHGDIVKSALSSGKAVFCEKPIAEDIPTTKACYAAAALAGKPLVCSFNRRFDPSIRSVWERVQCGEVGSVHVIKTCSRDNPVPPVDYLKISGGIFHDCAVHDIDLICWILKEYPAKVYTQACAHIPMIRDLDDVDTVLITLTFPSGVLASIDLSRKATYGYDQRIEVFGDQGMLQTEGQRDTCVSSFTKGQTSTDCLKFSFPQRYRESYVNSLEHFLDLVQGKAENEVTGEQTVKCSIIASACEESHRTNQPITINYSAATMISHGE